ncbi:MAG: 16S rRNA (adenine(1518)-N(6)/adenine(1519)-N(6))-dimethyltransferase [Tropheryma whipplei]|uniref:ribosomal RNA small subunit methyltransferase A n=1 Tax=Tropheryma whipplei TaxID=2039 RepID=UPI000000C8B3|nr:rRNA adenine dimethyltransferase family protein [Tropheryma whipplei]MCO8183049.1 16S rRNA (adenine(1518)-N(6)/adenine(1519)-N(6))-dimethyltransferase [Tropheryma whipplei]CAD67235.1 dimethyladenosine transferase [Tropheryma whipplei TW08/27]
MIHGHDYYSAVKRFVPYKRFGQHFVTDPNICNKIVTLAGVAPGDCVLEIGPGFGALTVALAKAKATVCGVEIDTRLFNALCKVIPAALSAPQPCTGQSHTDQPCDLGRLCDPHELPHRFTDERTNKLPTSQLHGLQLHGLQHLTNQGRCDTGLQGDVTQGVRHSTNLNRDDQRGANQHSNRQYSDGQYRSVQHSTVEESILEAEKLSIAARTNTHSTDTRHDNTHEHMRKWGEVYLINDDALKLRALPITPKMLVANLPYNIAVPLIMHVLQQFPSIVSATIMLQSEVADRICAKPPSRSAGAVTAKAAWFGHWKKVMKVARHVFYPIPGVDSVIVQFIRDEKSDCEVLREATFSLIEDAFSKRRKMLRQSLRYIPQADFVAAGIDPMLRAENLSVDNFMNLAKRRVYSTGRNLTHLA